VCVCVCVCGTRIQVLSVLGVEDEAIVSDYVLSDTVCMYCIVYVLSDTVRMSCIVRLPILVISPTHAMHYTKARQSSATRS
jgi:hypothetical protein